MIKDEKCDLYLCWNNVFEIPNDFQQVTKLIFCLRDLFSMVQRLIVDFIPLIIIMIWLVHSVHWLRQQLSFYFQTCADALFNLNWSRSNFLILWFFQSNSAWVSWSHILVHIHTIISVCWIRPDDDSNFLIFFIFLLKSWSNLGRRCSKHNKTLNNLQCKLQLRNERTPYASTTHVLFLCKHA